MTKQHCLIFKFTPYVFSWPYHAARLLTALWDPAQVGRPATSWRSPWLIVSLLVSSWDWQTHRISNGHLHMSFQNAHDFSLITWLLSLIYTGQREIPDWRLGHGSICNTLRNGKSSFLFVFVLFNFFKI